jgi:hypothetical protein
MPDIISEFRYQRKQPQQYYKHNLDAYDGSPACNSLEPQSTKGDSPPVQYRYSTKVDMV